MSTERLAVNRVSQVVDRDEEFEAMLVSSRTRLYRAAFLLAGSTDQAEDLTQKALMKAWQSRGRFRRDSAPYTWLYRILVNLTKDLFKAQSRARVWLEEAREFEHLAFEPATAESRLVRLERREQVRQALDDLGPKMRQVLILRHYEELSYDEIAGVLECPVGTVRSRLSAARAQLRSRLAVGTPGEQDKEAREGSAAQ